MKLETLPSCLSKFRASAIPCPPHDDPPNVLSLSSKLMSAMIAATYRTNKKRLTSTLNNLMEQTAHDWTSLWNNRQLSIHMFGIIFRHAMYKYINK